jgi:DNA-binding NarL/FixJ family response regulator
VFLVEDLHHMQGVVADLLASLGDFQVAQAASTEAEAMLWLDENPGQWDLAVIDLMLEQGTGMGVISRCANRAAATKVVVFSDYATPGIRRHCLKLGADAVFQKSIDVGAFMDYCSALDAGPV